MLIHVMIKMSLKFTTDTDLEALHFQIVLQLTFTSFKEVFIQESKKLMKI